MARSIVSAERGVGGVARRFYNRNFVWKRYELDYKVNKTQVDYCEIKYDAYYNSTYPGVTGLYFYLNGIRLGYVRGPSVTSPILANSNGLYIPDGSLTYSSKATSIGFGLEDYKKCLWFDTGVSNMYYNTGGEPGDYGYEIEIQGYVSEDTSYQVLYQGEAEYGDTGYYLYKMTPVTSQGSYIDDVESDDENAYPDNGIQDGYWYVKQ